MAVNIITIGTWAAPQPSMFECSIQDVDSSEGSGRSQEGTMFRDRVAVKRKLQVSWNGLSHEKVSQILQHVSPEFISVTYPDPLEGKMRTANFYVGDRSAPMWRYIGGVDTPIAPQNQSWIVETLSFNFIEK